LIIGIEAKSGSDNVFVKFPNVADFSKLQKMWTNFSYK